MAIGVQADMATPALMRFGSEELKKQFLVPTIAGDFVACLGVSEPGAGSDVASIKTVAVKKGGKNVFFNVIVRKKTHTEYCNSHFFTAYLCLPEKALSVLVFRSVFRLLSVLFTNPSDRCKNYWKINMQYLQEFTSCSKKAFRWHIVISKE